MIARGVASAVLVVVAAAALLGCRERAAPASHGEVVIAPVADPRPRPAEVAPLTLKVLGMT